MRKWYSESVTSKSWFSRLDNRRFPIRYDCIHEFSHASARHQRRIEIISALLHLDTLMLAKLFVEPFARKRHEQVLAFIGAREMAIVEAAYNTAKTASDK